MGGPHNHHNNDDMIGMHANPMLVQQQNRYQPTNAWESELSSSSAMDKIKSGNNTNDNNLTGYVLPAAYESPQRQYETTDLDRYASPQQQQQQRYDGAVTSPAYDNPLQQQQPYAVLSPEGRRLSTSSASSSSTPSATAAALRPRYDVLKIERGSVYAALDASSRLSQAPTVASNSYDHRRGSSSSSSSGGGGRSASRDGQQQLQQYGEARSAAAAAAAASRGGVYLDFQLRRDSVNQSNDFDDDGDQDYHDDDDNGNSENGAQDPMYVVLEQLDSAVTGESVYAVPMCDA